MAIEPADRSELLKPFVPRLLIQWLREWPGVRDLEVPGSLAFVDISGFTRLTERLATKGKIGAEELTEILDAVFGELLDIAYADGAGLIKWGGDAVLLLFHGEEHAVRACHAAYGMRRAMRRIGRVQTSVGRLRPNSPTARRGRCRTRQSRRPGMPPERVHVTTPDESEQPVPLPVPSAVMSVGRFAVTV